jgi:hypothetical protein
MLDGPAMSALAESVAAPFSGGPKIVARRLLSLLAALVILIVALPTAFGGGSWRGGIDPAQFFASDAPPPSPDETLGFPDRGLSISPPVPITVEHGSDSRQTRREAGTQSKRSRLRPR